MNRKGFMAEGELRRIPKSLVVLLVLVAFPLLIILAFLSSLIVLPQLANLPPPQVGNSSGLPGFSLPHRVNDTLPALIGTNDTLAPVPETLLVAILAALAIAAVAYAILRAYRDAVRVLDSPAFAEETRTEEKRREVTEILDAAASELVLGADYRDTVLRCYKLISE